MYALLQDIRVGIRNLITKPGFTVVATVTLALGIGANTAIFSVVNGLMFRELPVPAASQLVSITARSSTSPFAHSISFPDFQEYRSISDVIEDGTAFIPGFAQLTAQGIPERVMVTYTTANYFSVLRLDPEMGAFYRGGASELEGENQVVLSHSYWASRFAKHPDVVGQKITLNGLPVTIAGVTPTEFQGTVGFVTTNIYVPIRVWAQIEPGIKAELEDRGSFSWRVVARLREGFDLERAAQAVTVRAANLGQEYPETNSNLKVMVYPEPLTRLEPSAADYLPMVARIFMGMVSLVLLIACANVASLLLVRAAGRRKEVAVRSALGAARWRIIRQLLVESLLISSLGGICGLGIAHIVTNLLGSIRVATDTPLVFDFSPDYRVFFFAIVTTLATGIVAGLLPALKTIRTDLFEPLRDGGRGTGAVSRQRLRSLLVTAQVAVSLVLLVCTGLFLRSMNNVGNLDPGFAFHNRAMLAVDTGLRNYDTAKAATFFKDLLREVRSLPGVKSATTARSVPLGFNSFGYNVYVEGEGEGQTKEERLRPILSDIVETDYFATLGFRLLDGRLFEESDNPDSRQVAVVNTQMSETLWPNQSPLGKRFSLDKPGGPYVEVVGIVNTAFYSFPGEPVQPFFYLHYAQRPRLDQYLFVHAEGDPESILPALRRQIANLDPNMPIYDVRSLRTHVQEGKAAILFRLPAILVGMFALIGAVMASSGLYGLISYSINQRTHEIGVRLALGASSGNIIRLVSGQGMLLAGIGVVGGLATAAALTRMFSNILIGVSALDPLTYGSVALLLLGVAAISCFLPARLRAGRVDPVDALRGH